MIPRLRAKTRKSPSRDANLSDSVREGGVLGGCGGLTKRKRSEATSIEYELRLRIPPLRNEVIGMDEALSC